MRTHELYWDDIANVLRQNIGLELLEGKRLLITGATGMVGTCLIDLLMAKKIAVVALARNEERLREIFADYLDLDYFDYAIGDINQGMPKISGKIDVVIHAASNSHPIAYAEDPIGTIKTNVFGLDNLLKYAVAEKVERFLFVSSVEIYGENTTEKERFTEIDCGYIDCNTLRAGYPESKRLGEALCQAYREQYGLDVVIARLSRLYGPTMRPEDSKVINQFIQNAVCGEAIVLKSAGKAKYSYTYIVDAVTAILAILTLGASGEAYNVADEGSEISILELAESIAAIADVGIVYNIPDEAERKGYSNVQRSVMSAEKLRALGWKSHTGLQDGLKKTLSLC